MRGSHRRRRTPFSVVVGDHDHPMRPLELPGGPLGPGGVLASTLDPRPRHVAANVPVEIVEHPINLQGPLQPEYPAMRDYAHRTTTPAGALPLRLMGSIWRQRAHTPRCPDAPRLAGKLAVVTGGNAGIG